MTATYHVARDGRLLGAWPADHMAAYYAEGRVAPHDWVWCEGMDRWRLAEDVFGLPTPPRLHWAWVLLLTIATFGVFYVVWAFVQARWVKRIDTNSNALMLLVVYLLLTVFGEFITDIAAKDLQVMGVGVLTSLAGTVAFIVESFSVRQSLLRHFNAVQPMGLKLSRVMTFFFNVLYVQYHFTRIAKSRRAASR